MLRRNLLALMGAVGGMAMTQTALAATLTLSASDEAAIRTAIPACETLWNIAIWMKWAGSMPPMCIV